MKTLYIDGAVVELPRDVDTASCATIEEALVKIIKDLVDYINEGEIQYRYVETEI